MELLGQWLNRACGKDLRSNRLKITGIGGWWQGKFFPSHLAELYWQQVLFEVHMTRFKQICLEFTHSHVPLGTIHLYKRCHFFVFGCVNVLSCMPVSLSQ